MRDPREKGLRHHPPINRDIVETSSIQAFEDSATVRRDVDSFKNKNMAAKQLLLHHGNDETVDIVDSVLNPTGLVIIVLVSFTVPRGQVAYFDQVGVYYSEPIVCSSLAVGWRISVDGGQVPNIRHDTERWRFSNYGDIADPMSVKPIWVQSGQTISVELQPHWAGAPFENHLTMIGRLTGLLYKPTAPVMAGVI